MANFFPPDVSVRLRGDRATAQTHVGDARALLFRAINTGNNPCSLVRHFDDGTSIQVLLAGNQKIITVIAPAQPIVPETPTHTPPPPLEPEYRGRPIMYSGWVRNPRLVGAELSEFYPSAACAAAYNLERQWQAVAKLGTSPLQVATVTPGQFSGAMKRVVQALLGVGFTVDEAPQYLTGIVTTTSRQINATYSPLWTRTHGIYKAGPKNHWIVEISSTGGVLAMPLITLPSSRSPSFYRYMQSIGDTDTLKVLDEFGGIPNGETIPTGVALSNAISAKTVIRLKTAAEMAEFYSARLPYSPSSGWAFSETSGEAVNVCWGPRSFSPFTLYTGQMWHLRLSLSEHDQLAPSQQPPQPCGSGSATLEMRHEGLITSDGALHQLMIPRNTTGELQSVWDMFFVPWLASGQVYQQAFMADRHDLSESIVVTAYFDGNILKRGAFTSGYIVNSGQVNRCNGTFHEHPTTRFMYSPPMFVHSDFDFRYLTVSQGFGVFSESHPWPFAPNPPDRGWPVNPTGWSYPHYRRDTDLDGLVEQVYTPTYDDGWGDQAFAASVGPGTGQLTLAVLPLDNRESFVVTEWGLIDYTDATPTYYSPKVTAMHRSGFGVVRLPDGTGLNQAAWYTYYSGVASGRVDRAAGKFASRVSARQKEYVMSAHVAYLGADTTPPAVTDISRPSIVDIQPHNLNWVGAPD